MSDHYAKLWREPAPPWTPSFGDLLLFGIAAMLAVVALAPALAFMACDTDPVDRRD